MPGLFVAFVLSGGATGNNDTARPTRCKANRLDSLFPANARDPTRAPMAIARASRHALRINVTFSA
jgi:hypothetical protein